MRTKQYIVNHYSDIINGTVSHMVVAKWPLEMLCLVLTRGDNLDGLFWEHTILTWPLRHLDKPHRISSNLR